MRQRLPESWAGQVQAQPRSKRRPQGKTRQRKGVSLESDALTFVLLLVVLFVGAAFVVYWAGSWGEGEHTLSRPISLLRGAGSGGDG